MEQMVSDTIEGIGMKEELCIYLALVHGMGEDALHKCPFPVLEASNTFQRSFAISLQYHGETLRVLCLYSHSDQR